MRSKILAGTIIFGLLAVIALGIVAASPNSQTSTDTRTDAEKAYDLFIAAMKDFIPGGNANTALSNITDRIIEVYTEDDPSKTAAQVKNEIVASIGGDPTVSDILKATFKRFDPSGQLATALANVIIDIRSGQTGETPAQIRARLSTPPTPTPTPSPTGSPTATPSPTPTPTGSPTATPTATPTPVPPTAWLDIWKVDWDADAMSNESQNMVITWDETTRVRRALKTRASTGTLTAPDYITPAPALPADYGAAIDASTTRITAFADSGSTATQANKLDEYVYRARLYFDTGQYAKAVTDLTSAINLPDSNLAPNDYVLQNLRGIAHAFNNDYAKAIADFTTVLENESSDVRGAAHNNRAVVKALQADDADDYDDALTDHSTAISHSTNKELARNNRGSTYWARGKADSGRNDCDDDATSTDTDSDIDCAIKDYGSAIASDVDSVNEARFANNRGLAHMEKGKQDSGRDCDGDNTNTDSDLECAIKDFTAAIGAHNDLTATEKARFYNNRGLAHVGFTEARTDTANCDGDSNNDPDSHLDCAIFDFTQAIDTGDDADKAAFLKNRGNAYFKRMATGDLNDAISDYSTAISTHGANDADTYNRRGLAYLERKSGGDSTLAINDFTEAIRKSPTEDHYSNRAKAYIARNGTGDKDDAISDYTSAIKINPANSALYTERGNTYRADDQDSKASQDLLFANKINTPDVDCNDFVNFDTNYGTNFGSDRDAANAFYAAAKKAGNADDFSALLTNGVVCPTLSSSP